MRLGKVFGMSRSQGLCRKVCLGQLSGCSEDSLKKANVMVMSQKKSDSLSMVRSTTMLRYSLQKTHVCNIGESIRFCVRFSVNPPDRNPQ